MAGSAKKRYPRLPPSDSQGKASAGGYDASFYPGFVRRLVLVGADGAETVMYEQEGSFVLPPGQTGPWPTSTFTLSGNGRNLQLQLNDPEQQVESIEIVLKPRKGSRSPERLILYDGPVYCPPVCPEPAGPG
ncbi:MAG TPA: hypothetical protein VFR37_10030 [Longimicrobium sp.]|nr:hypothetical protein [Longimicrobium sp.]